MTSMKIQPAKRVQGSLRLPGDKSISHRAALIAAIAQGRTRIENFATSRDCDATLRCLEQLGVSIERDGTTISVEGIDASHNRFRQPDEPLDCDNSGTTMRLLSGVLAWQDGLTATLTGDASLRSRPMRRIVEPLRRMGARIGSEEGHAPLIVSGRRPLEAINYRMPVASAQVKSAILLAGLGAHGRTVISESGARTRDHTERLLALFGADIEITDARFAHDAELATRLVAVRAPARLAAHGVSVPGDFSSATFFIAAALMLPNSDVSLEGVGLNPTRTLLLDVLRLIGARIEIANVAEESNELVGDIRVRGGGDGELAPTAKKNESNESNRMILRGRLIGELIDELPMLAVLGTQIEGGLEVRDASELRVKESDRIAAVVENLRRMNADVEEFEDGFRVAGRTKLRGAEVDSHGDHRIAMAFAVAALTASGETKITGAESVAVSFPEFFTLLDAVIER